MTRFDALTLLNEGVYWAWNEGQAGDDLIAAARAMIAHFGIERAECGGVAAFNQLWEPG